MASIQRYTVNGKSYWRIVESRRINGKPRAIPILHLGSANALLERLTKDAKSTELKVKSFEHGAIAALLEIAKELEIESVIEQFVPKAIRGVATGTGILFMALNRLIDPCSKNSWINWAKKTSLFRFYPQILFSKLTSQFFWEHMQTIPEAALSKIEDELVAIMVKKYDLKLDLLFFDTTNCYSYVEDRNDPEWLFQYGHSKEKQDHRRLFGVELLVTRESSIPIYHNTYAGNRHDSKLFPDAINKFCSRLKNIGLVLSDLTLVFDRGNLSRDNFKILDESNLGFVSALRLGDIPREFFNIPLQKFYKSKQGQHKGILYYTKKITLWGKERSVVFYISERAKSYQTKLLNDQIERSLKELSCWNASIVNQSTDNSIDDLRVEKKIESLRSGPYLKEILNITYDPSLPKSSRLQFSVDHNAKENIIIKYFGKRALVTNRLHWAAHEVIDAYFSQGKVEQAFRSAKDRHHISLRPQFHWTNKSLRVHVFSCFLALLLGQVLLRKAQKISTNYISAAQVLEDLCSVRLAAILTKGQSSLKNPAVLWKLEKNNTPKIKLFQKLTSS